MNILQQPGMWVNTHALTLYIYIYNWHHLSSVSCLFTLNLTLFPCFESTFQIDEKQSQADADAATWIMIPDAQYKLWD